MAQEIIKSVKDEEEFAYDNIPENLQNSNKACDMEDSIDSLDEIFVIPKIIIFTRNKSKFIENNKENEDINYF